MIQLQIETIAACNAKCVFCTYPTMKRKRGRMSDEVYDRILQDAQGLVPFIDRISLQGLGEPLMDKDIVSRVRRARQAFPEADISIYTNGSHLSPEMCKQLNVAGLTTLVISLTGATPDQRKGAMELDDFDEVVRNTDQALRIIPNTKVKLIYARDLLDPGDDRTFINKWGGAAFVTYEGNWAGESYRFRGAPHVKACHRASDQLMVLWDGTVALCCFDGEGHMTFGNVMQTPIDKIWRSKERQEVAQLHKDGRRTEIDLCRNCTGI